VAHRARASLWRATDYRFTEASHPSAYRTRGEAIRARMIGGVNHPAAIEAAPDAVWQRFDPFGSYEPTSKEREVEAGAHLAFLNLKGVLRVQPDLFDKAVKVFAWEFGLLGQFEREYISQPQLPGAKRFVAPEAVIDSHGKLRKIDADTEGMELIYESKGPRSYRDVEWGSGREERFGLWRRLLIARPSEMAFVPKLANEPRLYGELRYDQLPLFNGPQVAPRGLTTWEEIKARFGALMVLDNDSPSGASVLCTREAHTDWLIHLDRFPSPETASAEDLADYLAPLLSYVGPHPFVGEEDGDLKLGWRCGSLLEAMGLMLLWDTTGDSTIKKCASRGCPYYFRLGSQSRAMYCSSRCANRASTRMRRGQEP
jgi:hypothetical protein